MKKIIVTGSNGQLGNELRAISKNYNFEFIFTGIKDLDISNPDSIETFLDKNHSDFLINCAAYTSVDNAEKEKEKANLVNHLAVVSLADSCKKRNIKLIHISTDFVFDGKSSLPYNEKDNCNPISVYGKTKRDGELAVLNKNMDGIIIRTSWLYSSFGNNFVKTILRLSKERDSLGIVFDQIGCPTYARDLAKVILDIIDKNNWKNGIYHYSNNGCASWYDLAQSIKEIRNIECSIYPIKTEEYPLPAKRPPFSVLDNSKIKNDFCVDIPYWRDSLRKCLEFFSNAK